MEAALYISRQRQEHLISAAMTMVESHFRLQEQTATARRTRLSSKAIGQPSLAQQQLIAAKVERVSNSVLSTTFTHHFIPVIIVSKEMQRFMV